MISVDDVEAELDRQDRASRSALRNLLVLAVSLAVFAGTRVLNASWASAVILIVVILIHESGHWLAMRYFGYRDLQMFFIPFFGAAVSGKPSAASGKQEAIVSLLGPAPGVFLGIACFFVHLRWPQPLLYKFAVSSVFLNGFNLLPIYPLDGGRFIDAVLFIRHPVVELAFKVLAAAALAFLALRNSSISMGLFAVAAAVLARESHIQSKIARRLEEERGDLPVPKDVRIPRADLERVLPTLSMGLLANQVNVKTIAGRATSVWRRLCQSAPSMRATIALLAVYVGIFVAGAAGILTYRHFQRSQPMSVVLAYRTGADGRKVPVEEQYWGYAKVSEVPLNSEGLYDGQETVWTTAGVKREDGTWARGYWDGDWRTYNSAGNITAIRTYQNGRPVRYQVLKDGALVELSPDKWAPGFAGTIQKIPARSLEKPKPQ